MINKIEIHILTLINQINLIKKTAIKKKIKIFKILQNMWKNKSKKIKINL